MSQQLRPAYGDPLVPQQYVPSQPPAPDNPDDSGLLEYVALFRERRLVIAGITLLGGLAGLMYTLPQKPMFRAQARVEVQQPNDSFLNIRDLEPTVQRSTTESYIQTQMEMLTSGPVIDSVVQRLSADPGRKAKFYPDMLSRLLNRMNLRELRRELPLEPAVRGVAGSVGVKNLRNTNVVEITAEANDPRLAADFANAMTARFIEYDIETKLEQAQNTSRWLQAQIDELRRQLEDSERSLQSYAQQAGLLGTSERGLVTEERLRQVQQELSGAQAARMEAEARYRIAQSSSPETLSDVLNDETLRSYSLKLTELRGQMLEQRITLTPEHYKVKRLQSQIDDLEATLQRERSQILKRIANDYETAKLRESMLGETYARQAAVVAGQGASMVDYNLLRRDVETNRNVYEAMLRKVKEASVASTVRASSIRVINRAAPAPRPYRPRSGRDILLGLTTGLFAAIMFVALREKLDGKLREPGDLGDARIYDLGVILSSQHLLTAGEGKMARVLKLPSGKDNGALEAYVPDEEDEPVSELITWTHKPSPEAESFRAVVTSLLAASNGKRVFALTSALPKEGKTTITCNLAVVLAEIERKVLVIDADLRAPRVHDVFSIRNDFGFSDIAHDRHSLVNRPMETLVRATFVPNVYAIPSGPGTASIYKLLYSQRIEELLERAREEFDVVLIDTPPMLGIPDARVLARKTDGVVLVMRAGAVDRTIVRAALQRFAEDCTTVVGTVLNDWKPRPDHYGYYDRYYTTRI